MILGFLTAVLWRIISIYKKKFWVMYFDFRQNILALGPPGLSKKKLV